MSRFQRLYFLRKDVLVLQQPRTRQHLRRRTLTGKTRGINRAHPVAIEAGLVPLELTQLARLGQPKSMTC
jgi:hypothetical protein